MVQAGENGKHYGILDIEFDNKGVLSGILNYISEEGGSIITINQGIPINKKANVSLTINITNINGDLTTLMVGLSKIKDVESIIGRGGTILKSSRCSEFMTAEGFKKAVNTIRKYKVDCVFNAVSNPIDLTE